MNKVMIVTNSLSGGGAERSMNLLGDELWKRGWNVVLVPINSGAPDKVYPNCEIFPLNRLWPGSLIDTARALKNFNQFARVWNPDIAILNCNLPELFGAFLLKRCRLIIVEHSSIPWKQHLLLGRLVRHILTRRSAEWFAVSPHLQIWPTSQTPQVVVQNPIEISNIPELMSPGVSIKRLIYIGRLSEEKRPRMMLKICSSSHINVQMIGEGRLRNSLETESIQEKLNIRFRGHLLAPWQILRAGDLLIVPSENEGDGLVVVEGMQRGVPMLLADIRAFRRFGLPERYYCRTTHDFVTRIEEFKNDLKSLVVPKSISDSILSSRTLAVVGDTWADQLNSKTRTK